MRELKAVTLAAMTLFALNACAPGSSATDAAADEGALKAETQTYMAAYNAGDVEKIVALFGQDAMLMSPNEAVATGPAAIRASLAAQINGAKAAGVKLVPGKSTAGASGDTGWESGTYTVTDASGATVDSGSYLQVSHKSDGNWRYIRVTYNSDRPLPQAATPPEKK